MSSRDTFVIFDKDGDGTIDSKELSTVLKSMGYNPTKEEIQEMVDEVRAMSTLFSCAATL